MKRISSKLIAAFLMIAFCGCRSVESKVTAFHQLPQKFSGETFVIYPADLKLAEGQEFFSYAGLIAEKLEKKGLKLLGADKTKTPTYAVIVAYGIDTGREVAYSVPRYGQTGGGYSSFSGTQNTPKGTSTYSGSVYTQPQFGQTGTAVGSETVYKRILFVDFLDGEAFKAGKNKVLYEGRLRSWGSSGHLPEVLPKLISAMFDEFPGKSGQTRTINK
jgi:hypothetical protein